MRTVVIIKRLVKNMYALRALLDSVHLDELIAFVTWKIPVVEDANH
jgi:hypothetical protein